MTAATALDLADIQGNVLRGFRATHARHLALAVGAGGGGPAFLAALVSGRPDQNPQVSTAETWDHKPDHCCNVGLTADGLTALGVPTAQLAAFPAAFRAGSAARSTVPPDAGDWDAIGLGDVGTSAPEHWVLGAPAGPAVHLVVSLSTDERNATALDARTDQLRALADRHGIDEVACLDATALPHGAVHFGYRDGIAQPWVAGTPGRRPVDMQPDVPTGDVLIGRDHRNIYGGSSLGAIPAALGENGTYSAFRLLRQDVAAFEAFLDRAAARYRFDRELVAAKLVGRWRNGVPLTLSPDKAEPAHPVGPARINAYDYAATEEHPTFYDDPDGLRCPVGAHTRRCNPRGAVVMGLPHNHRVIRRAMPYGPAYDPAQPDDGIERGLVGHFICGDLENQFEFVQKVWINQDIAAPGLRGSRDPILGAQEACGGKLTIRTADSRDPVVLDDLPRLVDTRGSLYLLLPGIGALRTLAAR